MQCAAGSTTHSFEQRGGDHVEIGYWQHCGKIHLQGEGTLNPSPCPAPYPECWTCSGWSRWPGQRRSPAASPRRVCCPRNPPLRGSAASRICRQHGEDLLQESTLQLRTKCVNGVTDKTQTSEVLPHTSSYTTKGVLGFIPSKLLTRRSAQKEKADLLLLSSTQVLTRV